MAPVLGPFALGSRIGEGATSVVWSAIHVETGTAAALKVLKSGSIPDVRQREALRYEIGAVASLDHPSIVTLLDTGDVGAEAAADGSLPQGSPWVAMELLRRGSLGPWCGRLGWAATCAILEALLAGLAHAHARGVIHRDVKPGNVLLDDQGGARLADFGIAAVLDDRPVAGAASGTPGFMAPEQRRGRLRDLGPWTDLYAVGRLALTLVTGSPAGGAAGFPVPVGFPDWVARLAAPDPADRYGRCAEAATGLAALGTETDGRSGAAHGEDVGPSTPTWIEDDPTEEARPAQTEPRSLRLPAPADWRGGPARRVAIAPAIRLYGLRPVPLVGRLAVRDALWDELRAVHASGSARIVILRGPTGSGKTRLSEWLGERAHETGVGDVLVATHDAHGGPEHGLGPMVARFLRCGSPTGTADPDLAEQRLAAAGLEDPWDRRVVTGLLVTGLAVGPTERHAVLRRLLVAIGTARTAVVRLEDTEFGMDALGLALAIGSSPDGCRALVVVTANDEALAARPLEQDRMRALAGLPSARIVDLPPLDDEERRELVRGLLGLEPTLAASVEDRTAGNPAFAAALVGGWVERDLLVQGALGLELAPGAPADLPDDVLQVWEQRIAAFLATRPPSDVPALELAAALGVRVDNGEWADACAEAGVAPSPDLVYTLVEQGLATIAPHAGWSFAHGMLREAIERRARRADRSAGHHRACARALQGRAADVERVGLHLATAGDGAAVEPLLQASFIRSDSGEDRVAERLVAAAASTLEAAGVPPSDLRWGPVRQRWGKIRGNIGKLDQGLGDLLTASRLYRGRAVPEWIAVMVDVAENHRRSGELLEAERVLDTIVPHLDTVDPALRARWQRGRGIVLADLGRLAEAEVALRAGNSPTAPREIARLAGVIRRQGRLDEALALLDSAEVFARDTGNRLDAVACANERGETERARGQLAAAERAYLEAASLLRASGRADVGIVELNLATMRILGGRAVEAQAELQALATRFEVLGRLAFAASARAALLVCDAATADWASWDLDLASARSKLETTAFFEPDVARLAELAAETADLAGEPVRALDAFRLSVAQWRGSGSEEEARRVEVRAGIR